MPACPPSGSNVGQWIRHNRFEAYPCCGYDANEFKVDPRQCGNNRQTKPTGATASYAFSGGFGCSCLSPQERINKGRGERAAADWVPTQCFIEQFDATRFCALLGTKTILVIGDSTMEQAAAAIMNAIHFGTTPDPAAEDVRVESAESELGCQRQISFSPGDTLVHKNLGMMNRGSRWNESLVTIKRKTGKYPDLVLLTAGAHIRKYEDFRKVFNTVRAEATQYFPDVQVLWKTQSPGGSTLNMSMQPVFTEKQSKVFKWSHFRERDEWVMRQELKPQEKFGIMDVRPLYLRGDDHPHIASLHFCNAGNDALSLIPRLLQHWLAQNA